MRIARTAGDHRVARCLTSLSIGLACSIAAPSGAADFVVTSTADSGAGSLRQAVDDANASIDTESAITFSPTALGTLTIDTSLADITQDLTVDGAAQMATGLLIRGPGAGTALYSTDANIALTLLDAPFDLGDIVLGNGSRVIFDTSVDQTVDQAIRQAIGATASLEKLGAAELTLTGANAYTGGTTVTAGTLVVTSSSLPGDAVISLAATLAFDEAMGTPTYAGDISGAGRLEKRGDAELTLTGPNSYSGGTTVLAGTLVVSTTSPPGDTVIASGATLAFDEAMGTLMSMDVLSGGGRLEKRGDGALTLMGMNTYTGGTSVVAGSLIGEPVKIPGDVDVSLDATLELIANGMEETFSGVLSGLGTLDKSGSGRLILEGTNSIANLHVIQGTLAGDAAALSGNIAIDGPAFLEINEPVSASPPTLAGSFSGSGTVSKVGRGVVKLSGMNDVSLLQVTNGRIVGTSVESIPGKVVLTSSGTLTFNPTSDSSYTGEISGSGVLEKRGPARLELNVSSSSPPFTGTTDIRRGRLHLTGFLQSDVTVKDGATLEAKPGAPLTVKNLTLDADSQLAVTVVDSPTADLVVVSNVADLGAGSLELQITPGDYSKGNTITLVNATTLLENATTAKQLPTLDFKSRFFLTPLSVDSENNLLITVTETGELFERGATNRNQKSVARALDDENQVDATADLVSVIRTIQVQSSNNEAAAYDALGGEQISQFATARFELGERLDRSLQGRLREHGDLLRLPPKPAADGLPAVSFGGEPLDTVFWLEPFGVFGNIDGRRGAHDTDYTLGGVTLGADITPLRGTRVGAAFSYGHTELRYDSLGGSGEAHSFLGALYGGWSNEWLRVGLTSRIGYSDMETTRRIRIGTLDRTARADFDGLDAGGRLEAGAKLLRSDRYLVEPFISAGYVHLERSHVRESGAGSVNLRVERESLDSATVGAGVRARAIFRLDRDLVLIPELRGEWTQQLADRQRRVDASFQDSLAGSSFRVHGTELHRNAGLAGIAWTVRDSSGFEARFGYDLGFDADRVAHGISVSVNAAW